jgi:catechol 2,3-dioxygenase-like lactoylglutathione lyase family enzyme
MIFGDYDPHEHGTRTIPCLPSRDLKRTAAFFEGIGFKTLLIEDGDGYLIIRKGWVEIHYFPDAALAPLTSAQSCYIRLNDVDAAVSAINGKFPGTGFPRLDPPRDREWGLREAYLFDPDNNLIKIGSLIEPDYPRSK